MAEIANTGQVSVTAAATQMVACFSTIVAVLQGDRRGHLEIRVGLRDEDLLQVRVLGFGLLEDGDVGVGVSQGEALPRGGESRAR